MSVTVYVGQTGQRLTLDPHVIDTIEALRSWIAQKTSIQPRSQILLTAQGKQVRTQTLLTDSEVFVFDSSRLASTSTSDIIAPADSAFDPGTPPDTISSQNDLQAWHNLFRARKTWATSLLHGCEASARQAEEYQDQQSIIQRGLGVAVASLQQHVKSAEQKHTSAEAWAEEVLQEQDDHVAHWEDHLASLQHIPARVEFKRFIESSSSPAARRLSQQGPMVTLQAFLDTPATRKSAQAAKALMDGLADRVNNMRRELEVVTQDSEELLHAVEGISGRPAGQSSGEATQLREEIQIVVDKIAADLDHVQTLPRNPQSISQASKMALLHTRNYLPNLADYCVEMNELVQQGKQERDSAAMTAHDHMRTLSGIESKLSELYADVKALELPADSERTFATLHVVARLPSVYGQLLVECVRRREWVAKMKRDSATLQEEVATYQEEEVKRRKKWVRSIDDVANPEALQSNVLGIELQLQNEGGSWPLVTREELTEYLHTLTDVYGPGPVTEEMDLAIKDLDKPTRKQIKHAKAFKNGSMHEAAFGDTSLLLRGDEQSKSLREANVRLEEDLRAQKSRVRKLEDLLHRQSQTGRGGTGDAFTPQSGAFMDRITSNSGSSPQPSGSLSRDVSQKHRRLSSTAVSEEKKLAKRVVHLESELQAAKEQVAGRENFDAEAQKQVEEANSTKKDLMENMEAQQREFTIERRTLEQELRDAKERSEELENELDRLLGSRDDERTNVDDRISAFHEELLRLKDDAQGHAARAATEQEARSNLERKLELAESARAKAEESSRQLQLEAEQRQETDSQQLQLLMTAFNLLAANTDAQPPTGTGAVIAAVEELARKSSTHVQDLTEAVAFAKSENSSLWASNERQKVELSDAGQKLAQAEDHQRQVEEARAAEDAKMRSLQEQLAEEQEQARLLRDKFAEGETGSGVLRQRLSEEEAKAGRLSSELAEAKSHVNSMDVELMRLQQKHRAYHKSAEAASERLEKRAERAKDISQRLYAHNTRLARVLDRIGLATSYQDNVMIVERASKLGASTNMGEPRPNIDRTVSLSSPPATRKSSGADDVPDVSSVHWPDAQTAEEEASQYDLYLQQLSRFNIDTFSEAVVKRLRDFEYTAKKYNKEARESTKRADAYKERYVKLKGEAHAKVAVKDFKEGDLALFLPTRGQAKGAWAAFNIGCPHYFLAEKEGMRLGSRDFIVARISRVEQKVVDLSKSAASQTDGRSLDENSDAASFADDNPFDLSDGLTWWMVHANEERGSGGAPSTPGLGKSTVAAANVDAKGSIRIRKSSKSDDASKHLNKSLDSRRSSTNSKRSVAGALVPTLANAGGSPILSQHHTGDAASIRQRSGSQTSLRPPPAPMTIAHQPGLGISSPSTNMSPDSQPTHGEQTHLAGRPPSRDTLPPSLSTSRTRLRSNSPSKSIRSLQKHLEKSGPSPAKSGSGKNVAGDNAAATATSTTTSPTKATKDKDGHARSKSGWESLWQAEFSIESPQKKKGGDD